MRLRATDITCFLLPRYCMYHIVYSNVETLKEKRRHPLPSVGCMDVHAIQISYVYIRVRLHEVLIRRASVGSLTSFGW